MLRTQGKVLTLIVLLAVAALACRRTGAGTTLKMRSVDTDLGLSMELPGDYQTARTGPSLGVFSPQRDHARSPVNIILSLSERQPDLPEARTKQIAGRGIHYRVTTEPGGSGGEELRLRAWIESRGRFIVLDSSVQPESGGDPDFAVEWAILPTLRLR